MTRIRNADTRKYLNHEPATCAEDAQYRRKIEDATEGWREMMAREGHKPREPKVDTTPIVGKRIGPAVVPMGGSSLGNA